MTARLVHVPDCRPVDVVAFSRVSKYDWLLFLHMSGAFLLLGGGAVAGALNIAALRRERPSEVVVLFGLIRIAVVMITVGGILAFVFGLWLVADSPWSYSYGDGWVIAAIVLLLVANALGAVGGRREDRTKELARELAASGDEPTPELRALLRDPVTLALSYGSGLVLVVLLAIMIWKPGA
jgi:uncharacterized membrane protein